MSIHPEAAPFRMGQTAFSRKQQPNPTIVGNYIGGNPNLKAGKIEDKTGYFETEIRTKDNSLVYKLAIDKNTGYVRQLY